MTNLGKKYKHHHTTVVKAQRLLDSLKNQLKKLKKGLKR